MEEKVINKTEGPVSENKETTRGESDTNLNEIERLEEEIIRNDAIPETSKDTPGSNGAFPVGAFDTSKD